MSKKTYCNPVGFSDGKRRTNPDPFVISWCGTYYCYATDEFGVRVSRSEDLTEWEYLGYAISEEGFHHYWAPSVAYLNGTFYMYYSNIPAEESDCHQQHLKLAVSKKPEGPFVYEKTFFDQFSIDSHPFLWNGKLYMFYSVNDWIGTEEKVTGTCIVMDEMKSPYEFAGYPRPVILPSIPQEIYAADRFGDGRDWYTIEGACTVVRDRKCWLLYSANAYENVDYFVGTTVAKCRENAEEMKWKKYPDSRTWMPLLKKNDLVEGTGHNTVVKAPNMVDDWIVYHGRSAPEGLKPGVEQREMRIDPLFYSDKKMVCMGPSAEERPAPGAPRFRQKNLILKEKTMLCKGGEFYRMEVWTSGKKEHIGVRYGIWLDYLDERNYVELQVHTGQRALRVIRCGEGICTVIKEMALPERYDYTVPHLLRVQRNAEEYQVQLDEEKPFVFETGRTGSGEVGVVPYFSEICVHSFALTVYGELSKKSMRFMREFYRVSDCQAGKDGLCSQDGKLCLEQKDTDFFAGDYMEEFQLKMTASDNDYIVKRGERTLLDVQNQEQNFSVYHGVFGNTEWFLTDGKNLLKMEKTGEMPLSIRSSGIAVLSYRCTKI